ncbi:hypothetical protein MAR_010592, partial [Mya arenaria]
MQSSFILLLVAEHVLSTLVPLSTALQSKTCDPVKAANNTRVVIRLLQGHHVSIGDDRSDDNAWDTLYDHATNNTADVGVELSMAR